MDKIELAKRLNEIWEIEVSKNGIKSEVALALQDLKYDVVKKLII
tara:strand:- start:34 stop:168 length:135 start_codon:yes stop_codon:yes gene_type:complete